MRANHLQKESISGKLSKFVSLTVVAVTLCILVAFCLFIYKVQVDERENNLQTVAATIAKLVERPITLGDYGLVETYLSKNNLPAFVESFSVKNPDGVLLAGQKFTSSNQKCHLTQSVEIPIGKSSAVVTGETGAATFNMRGTFCDIRDNAITMGVGAIGIGIFLILLISFVSRIAVKRALRPLTEAVSFGASQNGLSSEVFNKAPVEIRPLLFRIGQLYDDFVKAEANAKVGELASQVAHDIRSPLTALRSIASDSVAVGPDQKRTLMTVIDRITGIADNLLRTRREIQEATGNGKGKSGELSYLVSDAVENLISEKREHFRSRQGLRIEFDPSDDNIGVFTAIDRTQLLSTLSNLIDNAIESIPSEGSVSISLKNVSSDCCEITVSDTGRGMSEDDLVKLGTKNFTRGKTSGSGLGFYQAKEFLSKVGGEIQAFSKLGEGTSISLTIPIVIAPDWLATKIEILPNTVVVVVDDDSSIYSAWINTFSKVHLKNRQIIHIASSAELSKFLKSIVSPAEYLFLVDFDFGPNTTDGLTLIKTLPQESGKLLVTSHFDDADTQMNAGNQGIKILPKQLVPYVSVVVQKPLDCVLIDDDSLIQEVWQSSAKANQIKLRTFVGPPKPSDLEAIPRNTLFYIDQNLKDGIKGTDVARELYNKGFRNLVLATGNNDFKKNDCSWIHSFTIEKSPPWDTLNSG